MEVIGPFNILLRPGLRKNFLDKWNEGEIEYSQYLRTDTTSLPEQSATIMAGPSRMYELNDAEPVTYEDAKMGPKVMGVDKEFGLGFSISKRLMEDDQYGVANQSARWLADAGRKTSEYRSAALLDDAFTGTNFKGIDSLALCHTTHTLIGNTAATVANRPAADIGLSMTGVTACLDLFMLLKDENNDPINMFPTKLVIGNNSGDLHRAYQIFGSDKEPFTAENQDNAIKKRFPSQPKIVISRFKASSKSYFFIDEKYNDAWYLTRRAMTFEDSHDFGTGAALFKATTRFLIWFVSWRGWVGVNPT